MLYYPFSIDYSAVTVNNCTLDADYTRVTNYSMMSNTGIKWRQSEHPLPYVRGENEPYYPMGENLYSEEEPEENCIFLGRLAEFKYYDMDKIIGKVLKELNYVNS